MRAKWLISLLALLLISSEAMAEVVVIMRREAQTAGRYVRVCDVARVDGPKEQAREVAETVLGPAPATGEIREITRWDIESRLFEMGIAAQVSFSGNNMVMVRGDGVPYRRYVDGDSFRRLGPTPGDPGYEERRGYGAGSFDLGGERPLRPAAKPSPMVIERNVPGRPRNLKDLLTADARKRVSGEIANYFVERYRESKNRRDDIEVEAKIISSSDEIPYSAYELKVADADGRIPGKASLKLTVRDTDESTPREVTVLADTEVFGRALVAARNISRNESLAKDDVVVSRVRMESGKSYLPPNPQTVVGRETKRSFKPGEVILAEEAPAGDAVKRGNVVVVNTEGRGWGIQGMAKAHGSGAVGDIITVEDMKNKTKYPARITAPGTVSVVVRHDPHGIVKK